MRKRCAPDEVAVLVEEVDLHLNPCFAANRIPRLPPIVKPRDVSARFWNLKTGELVCVMIGHNHYTTSVA